MQSPDQREAARELDGIFQLLKNHPGFRVASVRRSPLVLRAAAAFGRMVRWVCSRSFCAEFGGSLTLLSFRVRLEHSSVLELDLLWHAEFVPAQCFVFVHFTDETGAIRFQADHQLPSGQTGPLRLLPSRSSVPIPQDIAAGACRMRLGVWSPPANAHLPLTKSRGCTPDSSHGFPEAVILGSDYP